jgi:hypothetical protein
MIVSAVLFFFGVLFTVSVGGHLSEDDYKLASLHFIFAALLFTTMFLSLQ